MNNEVAVIIIGGGPIGLTLSCILGKNNIRHVLFEKNNTTSKWPKAMLTNTRSMELLHKLGLDAALREQQLNAGDNSVTLGTSMINDEPILQFPIDVMTGKNPRRNSDSSYTFDEQWTPECVLRLSQIHIEIILKKVASGYDSAEIKFGWQVELISEGNENVAVEAVNIVTGERKVYTCQYAVGCDGGKSFVRKSLGIPFRGQFDLADMKSISFRSEELRKRLVVKNILGALTLKRDLQAFTLPIDDGAHFVSHIFRCESGKTAEENVRALLDNEDIPCDIVFANDWQGHFASAETLRKGRIFLAGDACHVMVPVGGFGMNTGLLDAFDLGWKLIATLDGWGGEQLLASYNTERLPAINNVLDRVRQMFYFITNYASIIAFLFNTRPFNYILKRLSKSSHFNIRVSGILFGQRLDTSPLCVPNGILLPPQDPVHYTPTALPGCRAPHFRFKDGSTLYDRLGSAFTLLHLHPSDQNFDPITRAAARCGIPLKIFSLQDEKLKTLYHGMDFVLIRPDLYIAWCGNEIPTLLHNESVSEGALALMRVVTGAQDMPSEWQKPRKSRDVFGMLRMPFFLALLVGTVAATVNILKRYELIG